MANGAAGRCRSACPSRSVDPAPRPRPCLLRPEDRAMSECPTGRPAAGRNLLFGVLALRLDFLTPDALVAGLDAWVRDRARPLGQVLVERGALGDEARLLLEAL